VSFILKGHGQPSDAYSDKMAHQVNLGVSPSAQLQES
jgi:hypothetical protein